MPFAPATEARQGTAARQGRAMRIAYHAAQPDRAHRSRRCPRSVRGRPGGARQDRGSRPPDHRRRHHDGGHGGRRGTCDRGLAAARSTAARGRGKHGLSRDRRPAGRARRRARRPRLRLRARWRVRRLGRADVTVAHSVRARRRRARATDRERLRGRCLCRKRGHPDVRRGCRRASPRFAWVCDPRTTWIARAGQLRARVQARSPSPFWPHQLLRTSYPNDAGRGQPSGERDACATHRGVA
jgi:hypothetical protein